MHRLNRNQFDGLFQAIGATRDAENKCVAWAPSRGVSEHRCAGLPLGKTLIREEFHDLPP
jgi:hypothetical protein